MDITMDDSRITNVTQIREFLKGSIKFNLSLKESSIEEKYDFIDKTVDRLKYGKLLKRDKKAVLNYLKKITGYKKRQLLRLISQAVIGELKRKPYEKIHPHRIYTSVDIKLLEKNR
jgi:hypothetical protein